MELKPLNRVKRMTSNVAVVLMLLCGISFAANAVSISTATGYVTVTSSNGDKKRLAEGDELNDGDVITTGGESSVTFTLEDGTLISLGALETYSFVASGAKDGNGIFASRSLSSSKNSLSTATSAGGTVGTTPPEGGSPSN